MTTKRRAVVRAAALAMTIGFTSFASGARAQTTTPAADPAPAAAPAPAADLAPASSTEAASSPEAAAALPPAPPVASERKRTAWPWIIMGTGVALIATAAVLQLRSVSEDDERESAESKLFSLPQGDPQRRALQDSAASHDDAASSNRTASLVVGTVGFLAVAGSVVWWFFEGGSSSPSKPASATAKATFTPSFARGYAGASLGASF